MYYCRGSSFTIEKYNISVTRQYGTTCFKLCCKTGNSVSYGKSSKWKNSIGCRESKYIYILIKISCWEKLILSYGKIFLIYNYLQFKSFFQKKNSFQVFSSYFERSLDENVSRFIKQRGFYHLANQISLFPASQELAENCLHLLAQRYISLDQPVIISKCELKTFRMNFLPPLLALVPRSVHNPTLTQNLISIIQQLFNKVFIS